jgi:hypothetical protein
VGEPRRRSLHLQNTTFSGEWGLRTTRNFSGGSVLPILGFQRCTQGPWWACRRLRAFFSSSSPWCRRELRLEASGGVPWNTRAEEHPSYSELGLGTRRDFLSRPGLPMHDSQKYTQGLWWTDWRLRASSYNSPRHHEATRWNTKAAKHHVSRRFRSLDLSQFFRRRPGHTCTTLKSILRGCGRQTEGCELPILEFPLTSQAGLTVMPSTLPYDTGVGQHHILRRLSLCAGRDFFSESELSPSSSQKYTQGPRWTY